jgi:hypothetical protein
MALTDKLKRVIANRYTPFFLPVIGSLVYIGLAILLIPENFDGTKTDDAEPSDPAAAAAASSGAMGTDTQSPSAKRRARLANRTLRSSTTPGLSNPAGVAQPMAPAAPPPAPIPASPDGAD